MPHARDSRRQELLDWLRSDDTFNVTDMVPASVDASFRRYFRVFDGAHSYIAMDAPPHLEDSEPFVRIARYLQEAGLNSPRVLRADLGQGFLLLTDLGDRQYLAALHEDPACADRLYADAVRALKVLQQAGRPVQSQLPPYDRQLLARELALFRDWLCQTHAGLEFSAADERHWRETCDWLTGCALDQPRVFVHRDYHSRNLMVCEVDNPGILDFQDAVEGPYTYDLVSLLRDCYVRLPPPFVQRHARAFFAAAREQLPPSVDQAQFRHDFDVTGIQRHLKAAGIFARLHHRDGKPAYLGDVPRTLAYITDLAERHAELHFLDGLIRSRLLPVLA